MLTCPSDDYDLALPMGASDALADKLLGFPPRSLDELWTLHVSTEHVFGYIDGYFGAYYGV